MVPVAAPPPTAEAPDVASLLDLVPDLGDGFDEDEWDDVRAGAVVWAIAVPPGPWSPAALELGDDAVGFLVAEGAIVRDVLLAGSIASDLLGPGDVAGVGAGDTAFVPADLRWTVSAPSRVVVIDELLLASLERWPVITARLLARATRQTSTMALQRAISQLPRVDQRLLALFWHLAERWGRVGRDGIVVRLALTHETLGRMVGARRPTVSLALKELATAGTVVRRLDGAWLLRTDGLDRLAPEETSAGWHPPDAGVLPDLGRVATHPHRIEPVPDPAVALRARVGTLDGSYADRERRVREVLERCAQTREELMRSRQRRAEMSARQGQPPPR